MNTSTTHSNYFRRMNVYLAEMFPVFPRLILAALLAFATILVVTHSAPEPVMPNAMSIFIVTFDAFALLMILRLMDELKDLEIDAELFARRPVPSGRTLPSDIALSLAISTAVFIAVNTLVAGVFVLPLVALAYCYLMFKYFFAPKLIANNLLLNLASHNPVTFVIALGLVEVAVRTSELTLGQINQGAVLTYVALVWVLFFAWEIARKVRSAEEETAYVTYSRVLGRKIATMIVIAAILFSAVLAAALINLIDLHPVTLAIVAGSAAMAVFRLLRFLFWPDPRTSALKPAIEIHLVTMLAALVVGAALVGFGGGI